jgi:HEAT repeat protein
MSDHVQAERIEQLIGALRDDNDALRDHAIASLSQVGEGAVGPLIGLMADEDVLIREAATSAIVRIGPAVVDRLIEALEDD